MSRTLRTALTAVSIALALAACGPASDDETSTAPAADTVVTEGPAETAAPEQAATEAETGEAPERTPIVAESSADEASQPEPAAEQIAAPAPAPVPEFRRCAVSQAPDGGEYRVEGIAVDDPDGGLTVRTYAGYGNEQIGLLLEGDVVGSYYDEVTLPSCLITRDGNVWWEVHHVGLPVGGWVNARYLVIEFGDVSLEPEVPVTLEPELPEIPEEEPDAHGDCVYLPDLPETCILVFRMGGEIVDVPAYDDEIYHELLYSCVYQGYEGACQVLEYEGQDIGAHLPLMSIDDVLKMCSEDGAKAKVGCAELDHRAANGLLDI